MKVVNSTYAARNGLSLHVDIYCRDDQSVPVGTLMYLHGGALIFGNRTWIPSFVVEQALHRNLCVATVEYRLAPETPLIKIFADIVAAHEFLGDGAGGYLTQNANPGVCVMGHSAGAYLAFLLGYKVNQPPLAIVSLNGYGDILGQWYSEPDTYYCSQTRISVDGARAGLSATALAGSMDTEGRLPFYIWCRQTGSWVESVTGWNREQNRGELQAFNPVGNVTEQFPPTFLLHGRDDHDVPCGLSEAFASALERAGVPHELRVLPDTGHELFGETAIQRDAIAVSLDFVLTYLSAS